MSRDEILDIRRRAFEEAAQIAYDMAEQNRVSALNLHMKANKQARLYDEDVAEQTKISAQVLDALAVECRCVAERIMQAAPRRSPAVFIEGGGDDGVERNPVPHYPPQTTQTEKKP